MATAGGETTGTGGATAAATAAATATSSGGASTDLFWSLLDKADRKFARLRDLPPHVRHRNSDVELGKAFKAYTQLWKLQQERRVRLVDAGFRRWEIGEIASRIGQIYYAQYQRTAEAAHLTEAYIFYEAILSRDYFKDTDISFAPKHLRFLARFIVVCLLLNRREAVQRLANQLRSLIEECKRGFQETEFREWRHVFQEIVRFMKVDTPFMNMRPLRYSYVYDLHPDSLPLVPSRGVRRGIVLRDAILTSYHHNEVKFTELTLDTFRMLQALEWEPCGSFSLNNVGEVSGNGTELHCFNPMQDIRDPYLPPNPRKVILYRPSVTHFLVVLAQICEELPPDGILLIYLSASGATGLNNPTLSKFGISSNAGESVVESSEPLESVSPEHSPSSSPNKSSSLNEDYIKSCHEGCLQLGSHGSGGSKFLYPCDLIPFTRKPIFLVIDSNNSHTFKVINGEEKGETTAMLLSPISLPPSIVSATDQSWNQNGSYFTMFLTAPVQAFCMLIGKGSSDTNVDKETYSKAEKLLLVSQNELEMTLLRCDSLHPIWIEALGDPFLRRLLLRFVFCRAALGLHSLTYYHEGFLPTCLPQLPESVDPDNPIIQSAVMQVANVFGATNQFVISDGVVMRGNHTNEVAIIKPSDIHESHFSAPNCC